jgi:glycosyltransferase involved in cell wall biosynthesis
VTRALIVHSGNMLGGVETVLTALARLARTHEALSLEFALAFDGPLADRLRGEGTPVVVIGPARFSRPLEMHAMRRRLAAHLASAPPDVVLTQSVWSHLALGSVVRKAGLPLALWVHDVLDGKHWLQWMAARVRPDLLICNSQFTARAASTVFPQVPAVVVYAPLAPALLDTADRDLIRRETDTPADAVVILQVGRTDPLKGHAVLFDALRRLPRDGSWVCWQVGAPQNAREEKYWRSMAARVRDTGLDTEVRWLGQRSDVARLLAAADVYCQPNVGPEAFGLTLAEALGAGLPVVTSRLGAAPEIVSDADGVLLPPGDAGALAKALAGLLTDRSRRRALGAHGPARVAALCDPETSLATLAGALDRLRRPRAA